MLLQLSHAAQLLTEDVNMFGQCYLSPKPKALNPKPYASSERCSASHMHVDLAGDGSEATDDAPLTAKAGWKAP